MEWVETTAKTVDEAKDLLLDRLGVHDDEAEFEVLEEPKPGLFGRTRGQARVRARVRPKQPRPKDDRRRRSSREKGKSGTSESTKPAAKATEPDAPTQAAEAPVTPRNQAAAAAPAVERPSMDATAAADAAKSFVTELLHQMGLEGGVVASVNDDGDIDVEVTGTGLGRLIGPRGGMIRVVEELCRTRLQHLAAGGSTPRVRVDVGGYRSIRRETLLALVDETIAEVRSAGEPRVLDVVTASERKLVHDRVSETADDVTTRSEGEDPTRRVVLSPVG